MLAPAALPERYQKWNDRYGAPFGRPVPKRRLIDYFSPPRSPEQLQGPFSIQTNNTTREFEYPWAFESAQLKPDLRVVELGGGLSGFQFVLDQCGCYVINVDPGMEAKGRGWPCDSTSMERLNHLFQTHVELRNTTMENANLADDSADRVFSISVLEHLTESDIANAMKHIHRCLKPGGLFILTVDLFLNLHPFCSRPTNEFGRNQDIRRMIEAENWEIVQGIREQLFGFGSFSADAVLSNLESYLVGRYYPTMVQCLVLKKNIT
jgi:SAM-dependent methyltransferase